MRSERGAPSDFAAMFVMGKRVSKRWEIDVRGRGVEQRVRLDACVWVSGEWEEEEGRLEWGVTAGNHTEKWVFNYDPAEAGRYGSPRREERPDILYYTLICLF